MLISQAHAQTVTLTETPAEVPVDPAAYPQAGSSWTMVGYIGVMVVLFYLLLIRPQQKRFKEHAEMLGALKKGDVVATGGGLIGKVAEISGNDEIVVDLGNGMKVTAVRNTIQKHNAVVMKPKADEKASKDKKSKGDKKK